MPVEIKPIPAFYCCYLLRSTLRPSSVYVGSTPHPARRLDQHNGKVKGGAVRTSRLSLRPWEMSCIVHGFPSNIAALQFEWAWQNAHLTRHIPTSERISFPTARTKTKNGKTTRRLGRPRTSLLDKLSNLHILLRAPYFANWPLQVRFFSEGAFQTWRHWCDRVDVPLSSHIQVLLDLPQLETKLEDISSAQRPPKRRKVDLIGKGGVEGIDSTYARLQDVLTKSPYLLDEEDEIKCGVCHSTIRIRDELFVICPHGDCSSISHVACLARRFLGDDRSTNLVPRSGLCPGCRTTTSWLDVMSEVSLRARGPKEIHKLLSKKKRTKVGTEAEMIGSGSDDDASTEDEDLHTADVMNAPADDGDDDGDDGLSVGSLDSDASTANPRGIGPQSDLPARVEIVIEDSDDAR